MNHLTVYLFKLLPKISVTMLVMGNADEKTIPEQHNVGSLVRDKGCVFYSVFRMHKKSIFHFV
jgi:hypothetical protein